MTRSSCQQKSTCCSERMERDGRWWWWWRRLRGGWCGLRLCAYLNRFHIKMQDINLKRQPADEESHAAFFLLCISTAIKKQKQKKPLAVRISDSSWTLSNGSLIMLIIIKASHQSIGTAPRSRNFSLQKTVRRERN